MKKIQLFLAAAIMVATVSAFATKARTIDEYVLINGRFELVSEQPAGGFCDVQLGSNCKYEKIANDGSDPYVEPGNFNALDTDQVWVP